MYTWPQTIGYALVDSPIALAAWMVRPRHRRALRRSPSNTMGGLGHPHARPHPGQDTAVLADRQRRLHPGRTGGLRTRRPAGRPPAPAPNNDPVRLHDLPRRDLADAAQGRASYPNVTYFHEVDKGGHFAAWEEPELSRPTSARRSGHSADERVTTNPSAVGATVTVKVVR